MPKSPPLKAWRLTVQSGILFGSLAGAVLPAFAQRIAAPSLSFAQVIVVEPGRDTAFPFSPGPADGIPARSFVRIRDLPDQIRLSEGHLVVPGTWAVSFNALANLKLSVPKGFTGNAEFFIAIVSPDAGVISERSVTLIAQPAAALASSFLTGFSPDPKHSPRQSAHALLESANSLMGRGHLLVARILYQRAAEAGIGEAALTLATTFDPVELAQTRIEGAVPDVAAAARWYRRAQMLGVTEVEARLHRLGLR